MYFLKNCKCSIFNVKTHAAISTIKEKQWENLAHCTHLKDEVHASCTHSPSSHAFSIGAHLISWTVI